MHSGLGATAQIATVHSWAGSPEGSQGGLFPAPTEMLVAFRDERIEILDDDSALFRLDHVFLLPMLELPVHHGAHRANHFGELLVGEIVDELEGMVGGLLVHVTEDESSQPRLRIMQRQISGQLAEGAHRLS